MKTQQQRLQLQLRMILPLVILLEVLLISESFSPTSTTIIKLFQRQSMAFAGNRAAAVLTVQSQLLPSNSKNKNRINNVSPSSSSSLFVLKAATSSDEKNDNDDVAGLPTYGGLLGTVTGLSMSAIRKSVRTTTGLSLTATRTALRGLTGVSVTAAMKMLFGIFPPWFRYFLQPFFICYYTPLMIMKYFLLGSTKTSKKEALASHEKIVEGWKDAIRAAEQAQEYWPLHVTDDGKIESLTPQSVPVTDAILESIDIASTIQNRNAN